MAEGGEKRSATGHRTKKQMSRHWQEYGKKHKPKNRSRKKARRVMEKAGRVKKGDGKEVDHYDGNANNNSKKNLRVMSRSANRRKA
jgi:hypothetical protein